MMGESKSVESGDNSLPTLIRRNNLYLSSKTTLLISGSESVMNVDKNGGGCGGDVIEDEATRIGKAEKRVRAFPPLLSSLNRNGRPKLSLETVRKDGRLQILIVPNHFSEVVRTPKAADRVSMELLQTGPHSLMPFSCSN